MRRTSLVQAKANLSKLVDLAEHKHQAVIILRHGKPAAALVPVDLLTTGGAPASRCMTESELLDFWSGFVEGDQSRSAVADLLESRLPARERR